MSVSVLGLSSFNSRPSCEGRLTLSHKVVSLRSFNSRPSCEGRLRVMTQVDWRWFQFTPLV